MIVSLARQCAFLLAFGGALQARALGQTPPQDRPQPLDSAALSCLQRATQPRIAQAQATLPEAVRRFQAGLEKGYRFFVTVRLHDAQGREEQVFLAVSDVHGDTLAGQLASEVGLVRGFHQGDRFLVLRGAVIDWTISRPDGSEEGNVLGKFLDSLQDRMSHAPGAHICTLLPPG